MTRFTEVGDRVWVAHYDWMHVNVTLVGGGHGLLVVDTHGSERMARAVADDVRRLGAGPLTAWSTPMSTGTTRSATGVLEAFGVPVHAHDRAAEHTVSAGERTKQQFRDDPDDPHADEVLATRIVPADQTFSSVRILDLGDRQVELIHPGRGHTAGDLVVRIPDADVLVAGDLVEESDPPVIGADCLPMEWPPTLDLVISLMSDATVVVPGHGALVDTDFVREQRSELGVVAETIRDLAGRGVPVSQALATGEWPWPRESLAHAVRGGYEHLPRTAKHLPLI